MSPVTRRKGMRLHVHVMIVLFTFSYIQGDGVNLLSLPGEIPRQYALNVMDALFTMEEMGTYCFRENSRTTKPGLDVKKVQLIEGKLQVYLYSYHYCALYRLCQAQVWKGVFAEKPRM